MKCFLIIFCDEFCVTARFRCTYGPIDKRLQSLLLLLVRRFASFSSSSTYFRVFRCVFLQRTLNGKCANRVFHSLHLFFSLSHIRGDLFIRQREQQQISQHTEHWIKDGATMNFWWVSRRATTHNSMEWAVIVCSVHALVHLCVCDGCDCASVCVCVCLCTSGNVHHTRLNVYYDDGVYNETFNTIEMANGLCSCQCLISFPWKISTFIGWLYLPSTQHSIPAPPWLIFFLLLSLSVAVSLSFPHIIWSFGRCCCFALLWTGWCYQKFWDTQTWWLSSEWNSCQTEPKQTRAKTLYLCLIFFFRSANNVSFE